MVQEFPTVFWAITGIITCFTSNQSHTMITSMNSLQRTFRPSLLATHCILNRSGSRCHVTPQTSTLKKKEEVIYDDKMCIALI